MRAGCVRARLGVRQRRRFVWSKRLYAACCQNQTGRRDVQEAQGARRSGSSTRGPATEKDRGRVILATIEYYATGRRKTSTARVFLRPGKGSITVNHREFDNYFPTDALRTATAAAHGDGRQVRHPSHGSRRWSPWSGRRAAPRYCARACGFNAELRRQLKKDGLLVSDARVKERKKYGLAGARKRFQFSKR